MYTCERLRDFVDTHRDVKGFRLWKTNVFSLSFLEYNKQNRLRTRKLAKEAYFPNKLCSNLDSIVSFHLTFL